MKRLMVLFVLVFSLAGCSALKEAWSGATPEQRASVEAGARALTVPLPFPAGDIANTLISAAVGALGGQQIQKRRKKPS